MSGIIEQGRLADYSSRTIRKVIDVFRAVSPEHGRPLHVLECGSGAGNVTCQLLPHLRSDDRLTSVEILPELVAEADRLLGSDPRVTLLCKDVLELEVDERFDFILNMIPTNPLSLPLDRVWEKVMTLGKPGSRVVTLPYCLNPIGVLARVCGRQDAVIAMKRYREIIEEHLERRILSLYNLPPCNVVVLRTKSEFGRAAELSR